ncbi:MAG: hypothetical protein PHQ93_00470 [Sulfurimonas sp.]|uniref:hypothetical protein n=1 Tax=Sulfurimonas sp. TaxID=2022749 RepID=UPI00260758C3|nr:hypothetical protein [Sulfurimonas sp.]MDD5399646.1 hypothetical protein [Sulfurimonas sp.]
MSEDFEKLKSIGVQKIHEATHIPRAHVQAILDENFEDLHSVQLSGFISILEREYSLNLSRLRNKSKEYFESKKPVQKSKKSATLLIASKKKKNFTLIYTVLGVVIFVMFAIFNKPSDGEMSKIDNSAIKSAQNSILVVADEKNASKVEDNTTVNAQKTLEPAVQQEMMQNPVEPVAQPIKQEAVQEVVSQEAIAKALQEVTQEANKTAVQETVKEATQGSSLKIISKNKVWLGYIDLSDYKQHQKTFLGEFTLDSTKNWLLVFGHGIVEIEANGVVTKFEKSQNIRFSYINSELKEINTDEFKKLNKGVKW